MTEQQIKAGLGDFDALWLTIWAEARSEPLEGKVAVASVIRNRALYGTGRFGIGYTGVCLKPKQFSCWNPGADKNHVRVMDMAEHISADTALRSTLVYDDVTREIQYIAQGILGGQLRSNIGRADHYLTTDLFTRKPPAWAKGRIPVAVKGAHAFLLLEA